MQHSRLKKNSKTWWCTSCQKVWDFVLTHSYRTKNIVLYWAISTIKLRYFIPMLSNTHNRHTWWWRTLHKATRNVKFTVLYMELNTSWAIGTYRSHKLLYFVPNEARCHRNTVLFWTNLQCSAHHSISVLYLKIKWKLFSNFKKKKMFNNHIYCILFSATFM